MPPIALLTDFGTRDPYVGIVKGVIAGIAPRTPVIDLCHDLPPFAVQGASWALRSAAPFFPAGTVFVAIVDPGVGGDRRILLARTVRHLFLAPDNGLLGFLRDARFRAVTNRRLFLAPVSHTFHGRDVFAPVAARLARGMAPARVGPRVLSIVRLQEKPGRVAWIDRFGNLVTNLEPGPRAIRIRGRRVPVVKTYASSTPGALVAVVGSAGTLEISVVQGSAARRLRAKIGDPVR